METLVHHPSNDNIPESHDVPFENTHTPEIDAGFEYKILGGHWLPSGEWKSGEKLRMQYIQLTDGLIQTMTEGVNCTDPKTGEKEKRIPSTVIFLDKSARPIQHLVRNLWPILAKDPKTGETPPMPAFKYLNIDRRQWIGEIDPESNGVLKPEQIHPSVIRSLKSIYLEPDGKEFVAENGLTEEVDSLPTTLDNETVLIVDETKFSGDTLAYAAALLGRAIPSAHIDTAHWMSSLPDSKGRPRDNPVWYSEHTKMGRGVNDRYTDFVKGKSLEQLSENYYRKFGKWFLSAPHYFVTPGLVDVDYHQLVREIKHLAAYPDVPIMPSMRRYDDDDRMIAYNYPDINIAQISEEERTELVDHVIGRAKVIK